MRDVRRRRDSQRCKTLALPHLEDSRASSGYRRAPRCDVQGNSSERSPLRGRQQQRSRCTTGSDGAGSRDPRMASPAALNALLDKTSDWDKDERYMATNDLIQELQKDAQLDAAMERRVCAAVLRQLDDKSLRTSSPLP